MVLNPKSESRRESLRHKLLAAWVRTDAIFDIIPAPEVTTTPIVWRHPFIFYIGHLPAFAWNQICGALLQWKSVNPYFDNLFCRGVDPDVDTGECHWHPQVPETWPSLSETLAYRDYVRAKILEALDAFSPRVSADVMAQQGRVFNMALEHEYMHQETLLYMLQQFPIEKKRRPPGSCLYSFQPALQKRAVRIPGGKACLGTKFDAIAFGWDNEFSEMVVDVPPFTIESLPVTNGEFREFVESGAYDEERYWRPEDWGWKTIERRHHPTCWFRRDGKWYYRAMFETLPLSDVSSWPVYASLAEARTYARWRGKRLPTEAEFHRAAYYGPDGRRSPYPWGNTRPTRQHGNFNFAAWAPAPVGASRAGASRWGVYELVGNGWELTDTTFAPFPGFTPYIKSYPDYSADFFDGKHFVVKGASWATDVELMRPSFRNWYQAHYPYVFAKFRCVSVA